MRPRCKWTASLFRTIRNFIWWRICELRNDTSAVRFVSQHLKCDSNCVRPMAAYRRLLDKCICTERVAETVEWKTAGAYDLDFVFCHLFFPSLNSLFCFTSYAIFLYCTCSYFVSSDERIGVFDIKRNVVPRNAISDFSFVWCLAAPIPRENWTQFNRNWCVACSFWVHWAPSALLTLTRSVHTSAKGTPANCCLYEIRIIYKLVATWKRHTHSSLSVDLFLSHSHSLPARVLTLQTHILDLNDSIRVCEYVCEYNIFVSFHTLSNHIRPYLF